MATQTAAIASAVSDFAEQYVLEASERSKLKQLLAHSGPQVSVLVVGGYYAESLHCLSALYGVAWLPAECLHSFAHRPSLRTPAESCCVLAVRSSKVGT